MFTSIKIQVHFYHFCFIISNPTFCRLGGTNCHIWASPCIRQGEGISCAGDQLVAGRCLSLHFRTSLFGAPLSIWGPWFSGWKHIWNNDAQRLVTVMLQEVEWNECCSLCSLFFFHSWSFWGWMFWASEIFHLENKLWRRVDTLLESNPSCWFPSQFRLDMEKCIYLRRECDWKYLCDDIWYQLIWYMTQHSPCKKLYNIVWVFFCLIYYVCMHCKIIYGQNYKLCIFIFKCVKMNISNSGVQLFTIATFFGALMWSSMTLK